MNNKKNMTKKAILSTKQAGEYLGTTKAIIKRLIDSGDLKPVFRTKQKNRRGDFSERMFFKLSDLNKIKN